MATKKTTTKTAAEQAIDTEDTTPIEADDDTESPIGAWAELLAEANLIQPYPITASITVAVPDPDRAQEIKNSEAALSLLRLKLAELLIDKSRETSEAQALSDIRDKLSANPGDLTPQELSILTVAIMNRRSGVPDDLFEQVRSVSAEVNERFERALLGDQYEAVKAYLKPQNYDVHDLLLADIKAKLLPTRLLPAAAPKGEQSSGTSTGTGLTSNQTSSTEA